LAPLPPDQVRIIDLAAKATPKDLAASRFWDLVGLDPTSDSPAPKGQSRIG
jgi:hypothetical protein